MKRILLFIESLSSGGAERQLSGLAVLLKKRGYDVKVLYYANKHFYASFLQENGVDYEYRPKLLNKYLRPLRLAKFIRQWKPDVVISYLPMCNMTACIARMFVKFPLIVSERNTNQCVTKKDKLLFNLYRIADVVVPNSHAQANFIQQYFPALESKTKVITNFVDTNRFAPNESKVANKVIKILTVARITEQKNCIAYLDAIKQVKANTKTPFHVDWFGNGYGDEYEKSVKQRLIDNGIEDVFTFHPASTEILKEYQSADIFCLPSLYEGYPNTVCEAMSCGLPILCSNVCDNPLIVQDGENGILFNPLSSEDMAQGVLKMLDMTKEERSQMAKKNQERAIKLFSREVFVEKYMDIISTI